MLENVHHEPRTPYASGISQAEAASGVATRVPYLEMIEHNWNTVAGWRMEGGEFTHLL